MKAFCLRAARGGGRWASLVAAATVVALGVGCGGKGMAEEDKSGAGPVVEIKTVAQFDELLKAAPVVLVDYYADWCGPCRALKPTIHEVANAYTGRVTVVAVNVDQVRELAVRAGIQSIPDVRVFKGGKAVRTIVGRRPKEEYVKALDEALR